MVCGWKATSGSGFYSNIAPSSESSCIHETIDIFKIHHPTGPTTRHLLLLTLSEQESILINDLSTPCQCSLLYCFEHTLTTCG